jgi:SpoVK/Ycf46/Vps4 family AAA+-type ATPase
MSRSVNVGRFDPYKNFKFRVKWDGKYVAGVKKAVPEATRDDLGFSQYKLRLLGQIVKHAKNMRPVRRNGGGSTILFVGGKGDANALAAEVIAGELGSNLYRVDLAAVSSKYIGDTQKNLDRIFDAAEKAGAVLFFDEADALFGKRTDVRDSHDRYANIEVSYLLRRLESYNGVAILTTSRKQNIDPAFLRRLRFIMNIPSKP